MPIFLDYLFLYARGLYFLILIMVPDLQSDEISESGLLHVNGHVLGEK